MSNTIGKRRIMKVDEIEVYPENFNKAKKYSSDNLTHIIQTRYTLYKWLFDYLMNFSIRFSEEEKTASIYPRKRIIYINPFYFSVLSEDECLFILLHEILHYIYALDEMYKGLRIEPNTVKHLLFNLAHDFIVNTSLVKTYKLPLPVIWIDVKHTEKGDVLVLNKKGKGNEVKAVYFDEWKKYGIEFSPEPIYHYLTKNSKVELFIYVFDKSGKYIIDVINRPLSIHEKISDVAINEVKGRGYVDHKYFSFVEVTVRLPNGEIFKYRLIDNGAKYGEEGEESGKGKSKEGITRKPKTPPPPPPPPVPPGAPEQFTDFIKLVRESLIPWRELLYKYVKYGIMSSSRGMEDYSFYPPSRRVESLRKYLKGIILPGLVSTISKLKAVVIVDISGSISRKLYTTFVTEVFNLIRTFEEYEILLIQCDDHVYVTDPKLVDRSKYIFLGERNDYVIIKTGQKPPMKFWREGLGTCYIPAFALVEKLKFEPNVLIYLTDLSVSPECVPPKPKYPVVWVWATYGLSEPEYKPKYGSIIRFDFHDEYEWSI